MADEVNEAFKVLRSRLIADPVFAPPGGIPVYASDQVPQGSVGPYVLIDFMAGTDVAGAGTSRIATSALMLARIVKKGSIDATERAADRAMDAVLQTTVRAQSGGYVFSVRREGPHRLGMRDSAQNLWSESGGRYRLFIA